MSWFEIKVQSDIEKLLECFGYFHDGCLKELHTWTGTYADENLTMIETGELDTNVKMILQHYYKDPSIIEIPFECVAGIHIIPSPENYDSIIRDVIILKHKENFIGPMNLIGILKKYRNQRELDCCRES